MKKLCLLLPSRVIISVVLFLFGLYIYCLYLVFASAPDRIVSDRISPSSLSGVTDRHLLMPTMSAGEDKATTLQVLLICAPPGRRSMSDPEYICMYMCLLGISSVCSVRCRVVRILIKRNIHIIPHLFDMR